VAPDRDVPDRCTIDDGYPRLELGSGLEPISEQLPGAREVGGLELAGEQLRRVCRREAAVVVVRNCIGVSRGRRPKLELIHRSILARTSGPSSNVRGRTPQWRRHGCSRRPRTPAGGESRRYGRPSR
jgi:hypothetical protein